MPKKTEEKEKGIIPVRQEPDINQIIVETYLMTKENNDMLKEFKEEN